LEIPAQGEVFGGIRLPSTSKHSAKVVCYGRSVWISPRQFWNLVRDDIVEYVDERPLTGRFKGCHSEFLVTVNHTVLSLTGPEHRREVIDSKRFMKR